MVKRRKKYSRSKKTALSILGVAEAGVVGNATTRLLFGSDLFSFFTAGWFGRPGSGGTGSTGVTLWELVTNPGGTFGASSSIWGGTPAMGGVGGLWGIVRYNIKTHPEDIATLFLAPLGFRIARRLLKKPIRMGNKALKMVGLRNEVRI